MTSVSRAGLLAVVALLGCGGGSQEPPPGAVQRLPVKVKLTGTGCDAGRIGDFRGFDALLVAPRSSRSSCVTGRPQTFAAIGDLLAGKISFDDLPEGPLTLKLFGYRAEECRGDKLGMCGVGSAQLAASVMEVELAVACDDMAAAAFSACVAR
jgi:hypothetical protein